jgi:hypothetical protein
VTDSCRVIEEHVEFAEATAEEEALAERFIGEIRRQRRATVNAMQRELRDARTGDGAPLAGFEVEHAERMLAAEPPRLPAPWTPRWTRSLPGENGEGIHCRRAVDRSEAA